jgi:hypothetical protein
MLREWVTSMNDLRRCRPRTSKVKFADHKNRRVGQQVVVEKKESCERRRALVDRHSSKAALTIRKRWKGACAWKEGEEVHKRQAL